ncbi:3870_t:CDS:2 [Ambispora leptoticha]|uniref:3870_t:CDS:1 n=1 Tax=Ambispora leptoticha TaxID=144679 RepID=A0A9N9G286_9GLOM|nr:3870_t:CDS:2 [Ambispora leptoticha]
MRSRRVPFTEEGTIFDQYSLELDGYFQEAINHRLDEFNRIDNPKQLNWRVITDGYKSWQFSGNQMDLTQQCFKKQDTKEDYFNNVDNAPPAYN